MKSFKLKSLVAALLGGLGVTIDAAPRGGATFGQGGAVVNLKSSAITNCDATPVVLNSCIVEKAVLRESQGFLNIANGDSIGSTYRICRIRSNERLSQVLLYGPAIANAISDFGIYDTTANGGAVVQAAGIGSAVALTGALAGSDITFESGTFLGNIANAEKRVWEALGLASDPQKDYDIVATLTAAATAAGQYVVRVAIATQV